MPGMVGVKGVGGPRKASQTVKGISKQFKEATVI